MNLDCEVLKYGELKGMVAGTTSILGEPRAAPRPATHRWLGRSTGSSTTCLRRRVPLPARDPASSDHIQVSALGVPADPSGYLANFATCKTWSFVVHVAEGAAH